MSSYIYHHQIPPCIEARLIQFSLGVFGMKRAMAKKIVNNSFRKEPARMPKSFFKKYSVGVENFFERKVWTISPGNSKNNTLILFLHGGAYYANMTRMHWQLVGQLTHRLNASFIIPDYPLAPESACEDTYRFLDALYASVIFQNDFQRIVFMGDSSGGGLALGFAMKIINEAIVQPSDIFLLSPWLDVSMSNPDIEKFDKVDKILNVGGLKIAGKNYAGDFDGKDFRVSPIYGDFSNLGRITMFIGTNEIFIADALKLKKLLHDQNISFSYFEYPGMFHDWVLVSNLKESRDVIVKIANCLS
jgi:acetyl esterase/lipase